MYCLAYRYCLGLFEKKTESREKTRHRKKKGGFEEHCMNEKNCE